MGHRDCVNPLCEVSMVCGRLSSWSYGSEHFPSELQGQLRGRGGGWFCCSGKETEHVKVEHVKNDHAYFCLHFREHCRICREHSRGSLRGEFDTENVNLHRGVSVDIFVYTSRVQFHAHFLERVRGSNFAVCVLCAWLMLSGLQN